MEGYRREPRSHINAEGTAKRPYHSESAARDAAATLTARDGRLRAWYLCAQNPDHWHVAKRTEGAA